MLNLFSTSANKESSLLIQDKQETTCKFQKLKETDLLRNKMVKQKHQKPAKIIPKKKWLCLSTIINDKVSQLRHMKTLNVSHLFVEFTVELPYLAPITTVSFNGMVARIMCTESSSDLV